MVFRSALLLLLLPALWLGSRDFFPSPSPLVADPVLVSDPRGALAPDEAARLAEAGREAIGLATHGYWWVAQVQNTTSDARWVVHLGNTAIERARLFVLDDGKVLHQEAVDLLALAREGLPDYTVGHHFPITLPPGSRRTVALWMETEVAHKGLIFIKPATLAQAEARFHMVAIWSAAGAIGALICYNLFLGVSLRFTPYLFYVGHAGGHLLYLLTALGVIGAGLPILQRYLLCNAPGIALGVLFGALFIYSFLELPALAPRLARLFRLLFAAVLASPLVALLFGPYLFLTLVRGSHLLLVALVISAALIAVHRGKREARYILVGWGGLVALTAKGMLGVLGVVELTVDAGIWALLAVCFEMFLLSLALADRVRRLNREKEAAQAASEAKSAFLATMSHEIRTPLNGVLGMVEILRGTRLDETQSRYLENIRQCGTGLLSVLNDILDYSRLEAGRVALEAIDFSPRRLLEGVLFMVSPEAGKKGLHLRLTLDPAVPPMLLGDAGRLRQVLLNLVGNAVKFTERGEVHLALERVDQGPAGNRLCLRVEDTGIGMGPETVERIFARFHQADSSIARRYGGTGLGLAIAKELVVLMGGAISVQSEPGKGSRFLVEVTLPTGTAASVPPGDAEAGPLPSLKILVVDDDAINRLVATELLARENHRVTTADEGAAALELLTRETFDLVLMDLSMPHMDGLEATRRLRASGLSLPVIGLSAHVLPEQQAACLAAGMDAVIHKPLQPHALTTLMGALVKGARETATAP